MNQTNTETDMFHVIRDALKKLNPEIVFQKIEQSRIPDIYFCTIYTRGWIELKIIKVSIEKGTKIPFRPGQYNWLMKHSNCRAPSFLFCYCKENDGLYVFKNENIRRKYSYKEILQFNHAIETWSELTSEDFLGILEKT